MTIPTRYQDLVDRTVAAVTRWPGRTSPVLRAALVEGALDQAPAELQPFLEKVSRHAYRVEDEDVEALKRAGHSEDAIFEVTAATALGAALLRLRCGMAALEESR